MTDKDMSYKDYTLLQQCVIRQIKISEVFILLLLFESIIGKYTYNVLFNAFRKNTKGRLQKKNRFFLGKSPKLWVGGGQES